MGYYSQFDIEIKPMMNKETEKKAVLDLWKIHDPEDKYHYQEVLDSEEGKCKSTFYYFCMEPMKWYEIEDDMTALSKLYPNYLFRVNRNGEDGYDFCDYYFKNGRSQHCVGTIVYEKPDLDYLYGGEKHE